jgi:hypothetical protein
MTFRSSGFSSCRFVIHADVSNMMRLLAALQQQANFPRCNTRSSMNCRGIRRLAAYQGGPCCTIPIFKVIARNTALRIIALCANQFDKRDNVQVLPRTEIHFQPTRGLSINRVPTRLKAAIVRLIRTNSIWIGTGVNGFGGGKISRSYHGMFVKFLHLPWMLPASPISPRRATTFGARRPSRVGGAFKMRLQCRRFSGSSQSFTTVVTGLRFPLASCCFQNHPSVRVTHESAGTSLPCGTFCPAFCSKAFTSE